MIFTTLLNVLILVKLMTILLNTNFKILRLFKNKARLAVILRNKDELRPVYQQKITKLFNKQQIYTALILL